MSCSNRVRPDGRPLAGQRGFTLIEIILALALSAMLLTLLSTGMYGVMNDWENDTSALDQRLDDTVAILQLERALQGAFPHSYRDAETLGRYVYFDGADDSLSWVSTVSPQRSGGLTAWHLESDAERGVFLRLAPAMSDNPQERLDAAESIQLLENYTASFSYLYEELDFSKRWREDWPGTEMLALPLAVHVLLTPIEQSAQGPGPLNVIARIRANEHPSLNPGAASSPLQRFLITRPMGPRSGGL